MTNRELSQAIRKDLKEHGVTSKDVSVRVRDALYDTSVNITIKNPLIRETDVESITRKYSKVDYDQRSMEILAGCNIYVHCEYAYGIFDNVFATTNPILATFLRLSLIKALFGALCMDNHLPSVSQFLELYSSKNMASPFATCKH